MSKHVFFVIDVESVGLHGEGFAVAGGLYVNGAAQWEFRYACDPDYCKGTDSDRGWVSDNIPLMPVTHRSPRQMRHDFWKQWLRAKASGAIMVADCAWPVESRFVAQCVDDNPDARRWEGPYPLMEIASFMSAAGMNPMIEYDRTPSEMPRHEPLADTRQSARLLYTALDVIEGRTL